MLILFTLFDIYIFVGIRRTEARFYRDARERLCDDALKKIYLMAKFRRENSARKRWFREFHAAVAVAVASNDIRVRPAVTEISGLRVCFILGDSDDRLLYMARITDFPADRVCSGVVIIPDRNSRRIAAALASSLVDGTDAGCAILAAQVRRA